MICKIACCDDDINQLRQMKNYFETIMMQTDLELEVDYYTAPEILLQKYRIYTDPYDVLVLDMEMEDMTGIEVAKQIREKGDRDVLLLFLTSYPKYMQQSFGVQPFQYMIKPVSYEGFKEEMIRAYQYIKSDEKNIIFVKTDDDEVVVRIRNIISIKKETGRAVMKLITTQGNIAVRGNFKDLGEAVNQNPFLRISRSCIVNMDHIYRFQKSQIEMDNREYETMSRRRITEIKEAFTKYAVLGGK